MPAPTKSWTTIANTSIDADSPIDETLLTAIRDNQEHLEEWLGGSFTAAVDHNHDGVNSAAIEIGPNLIRNGSFESGTTGWTVTAFTGGTAATNTSNDMDGATALGFTSTVLANGGGEALSSEFIACTGGGEVLVKWAQTASAANISSKVEVLWYDDAQSSISTTVLHTMTNTNTTAKQRQRIGIAPSTARYCKVKITGGIPATGSATGTVYFDGVKVTEPVGALVLLDEQTASTSAQLDFIEGFGAFDAYLLTLHRLIPATSGVSCVVRFSTDGGSTFRSTGGDYATAHRAIDSGGTGRDGNDSAANGVRLNGNGTINNATADGGINATVELFNLSSTDRIHGKFRGTNIIHSTLELQEFDGGFITADYGAAVNAVRVLMSSGNITSGTVRLYGVRKGA